VQCTVECRVYHDVTRVCYQSKTVLKHCALSINPFHPFSKEKITYFGLTPIYTMCSKLEVYLSFTHEGDTDKENNGYVIFKL
jgi:hypothetical protein